VAMQDYSLKQVPLLRPTHGVQYRTRLGLFRIGCRG